MTNKDLEALRRYFFLSVSEAAAYIGGVTPRTWQRWEAGKYPIPRNVKLRMARLAVYMQKNAALFGSTASNAIVEFGMTFERYQQIHPQATVVDWRISESITARYVGENLARAFKAATF